VAKFSMHGADKSASLDTEPVSGKPSAVGPVGTPSFKVPPFLTVAMGAEVVVIIGAWDVAMGAFEVVTGAAVVVITGAWVVVEAALEQDVIRRANSNTPEIVRTNQYLLFMDTSFSLISVKCLF